MRCAIISHNIDFVTFLMNEHNIEIDLHHCGIYNNLESFLVYFDQTNDVDKCFVYSSMFDIPSLCEYFISYCANVNEKVEIGNTSIIIAAFYNNIETAEPLLSYCANVNKKDKYGKTALQRASEDDNIETVVLLLSYGANVNEKDKYGKTALQRASEDDNIETAVLLLSYDANE